jgi:integrase
MASYNFYLKDSNVKTNTPIYLLFDDGVNRCKLYIQEKINPKDWNPEKREARKTYTGFSDFNDKLQNIKRECKEIQTSLTKENEFTIDKFRELFKTYLDKINNRVKESENGAKLNFIFLTDFATHYVNTIGNSKRSKTIAQNNRTLNLLKEFEAYKKRRYKFEKIDLDFYNDFVNFLKEEKKHSTNTIGKNITNIKLFLNEATERGLNECFFYKSKRFKAVSETVDSIYLNEDEIIKIYKHDFSTKLRLERVRDLFIIGCYTGLRYSDFSQLTSENIKGELITVKTQKTGEKVVIPLHPTVKELLKKYSETAKGLPRPNSNQKMNEYLKEIGREVKIKEPILRTQSKEGLKVSKNVPKYNLITTHTARRSFATNLYKNGFPSIAIMKITGHKTEKSFMKYIKVSHEENAQRLIEHWRETNKLRVV